MVTLDFEPVEEVSQLEELVVIATATGDVDHVGLPGDPIEERLPTLDPSAPQGGELTFLHLARRDGAAVGFFEIKLPQHDNLVAAMVDVQVHPDHRRQGFGRQLMKTALTHVREMGRSRVFLMSSSPWPEGEGKADRLLHEFGARPVLSDIRRLLQLKSVLPIRPPDPPEGYRVVQWVDVAPEEIVDDLARLSARMSTDPPQGDLEYEPEVWDAARYRDAEETAKARSRRRFATAVVHEQSGVAIGMTDLGVSLPFPTLGWQWATIVDQDHRGHGLGLVLKSWNLKLLAEEMPSVEWVNTWNAAVNEHMIAVNEELGFRPVEIWTEWQLDL